jgi:hypothetical protein
MTNEYTGEVPVEIDGEPLAIVFNFRALAALRSQFGPADFGALLRDGHPEVLAKMTAIGLAKRHSGWTADRILDLDASPGVIPVSDALSAALNFAYLGPKLARKESAENPPKRIVRKTLSAIRWLWPCRSRIGAG